MCIFSEPKFSNEAWFSTPNLAYTEFQALSQLFIATVGNDWSWRPPALGEHWNFTELNPNPCTENWQGINCSLNSLTNEYNVVALELPSYNLQGALPASIVTLTKLQVLSLNGNKLRGHLPRHLGNLTELRRLSLFSNYISGPIPNSIGKLHQLETLTIYSNRLNSYIPASIGNLTSLTDFEAFYNFLTGTLPDSIGQLTNLITLNLNRNHITGSIPETIGMLEHLESLNLASCALRYSLPNTLGRLKSLRQLLLYHNRFTGQLPASLGNLTQLSLLEIDQNALSGTLPSELCQLSQLETIDLYTNTIEGIIPACMGQLSQLQYLGLDENRLTGTLPAALGNLSSLVRLYLERNRLSGSIPSSFANLTIIQYLNLYANRLTGTIPSFLGTLTEMIDLGLDINEFTGTIPPSIGQLHKLRSLYMSSNALTQSVPDSFSQLHMLQGLFLVNNQLTGSFPTFLGNLSQLRDIEVGHNDFTGSIPSYFGGLTNLQNLYLDNLHLIGTIPVEIGRLPALEYLLVCYNLLEGSIPTSFSTMATLRELQVQHNRLTGSIENVFSAVHTSLNTVLVAKNQLTGTLPAILFTLSSLNTLVAVGNCFIGTLPATVCEARSMKSLVLDGLSSSTSCRNLFLPHVSSSYTIRQSVHGTIPACLFSLPAINTLHLSGNGFTGEIPDITAASPTLVDVSLSHNILTGDIPAFMQRRRWYNLDLSYNRISGSLHGDFATDAIYTPTNDTVEEDGLNIIVSATEYGLNTNPSARVDGLNNMVSVMDVGNYNITPQFRLSLENNRISGKIPGTLRLMPHISILGSNVFQCRLEGSDVPRYDSDRDSYECGSVAFDVPYYLWLSLCTAVVIIVVLLRWRYADVEKYEQLAATMRTVRKWWVFSSTHREVISHLNVLNGVVTVLCQLSVCCAGFILLVLLPVYSGLSTRYGALTHQYTWGVSGAFLTGTLPVAVEMPLLLLLLLITVSVFARLVTPRLKLKLQERRVYFASDDTKKSLGLDVWAKKALISALYIAINLVVVVGFNVAYVYISIYEDSVYHILAQIALSLFKIMWNNVCTSIVLRSIVHYITTTEHTRRDSKYSENEFMSLQVFVALVNNIAVPCLVVAVVSPSCFYSVFVPAPTVTSVYTYEYCAVFDADTGDCSQYLISHSTTSYSPPFTYNFQCSFSLITYYSPAFVSLCIVATFVAPAAQLLLQQLHQRTQPGTWLFFLLDFLCPRILKPLPVRVCSSTNASASCSARNSDECELGESNQAQSGFGESMHRSTSGNWESPSSSAVSVTADSNMSEDAVTTELLLGYEERTYFKANQVLITLLTYLGILLTFGAMFPPLAAAMVVTILACAVFSRLKVGRFLSLAFDAQAAQFATLIDTECAGIGSVSVLQKAMWMLITISCWFYSLFLFDTLGDAVGLQRSYWVLIVMPLMPVALYLAFAAYKRALDRRNRMKQQKGNLVSGGVELQTVEINVLHTNTPTTNTTTTNTTTSSTTTVDPILGNQHTTKDTYIKDTALSTTTTPLISTSSTTSATAVVVEDMNMEHHP